MNEHLSNLDNPHFSKFLQYNFEKHILWTRPEKGVIRTVDLTAWTTSPGKSNIPEGILKTQCKSLSIVLYKKSHWDINITKRYSQETRNLLWII